MSTLYIVATPIGNLEDITLRALRILAEVDLILCEDTRTTRTLLAHYKIKTATKSYHAHSSISKEDTIIKMLESGKNIALVSDAGTPAISDPGAMLVKSVLENLGDDVKIVAVPGASALTSAISISGILPSEFVFLGFLPHKKGRETLFKEIALSERTMVFYESSHRILKTLKSLSDVLGEDREVVVAREITKFFEEVKKGTSNEVLSYFTDNKEKQKGEFVVIVSGVI